MCCGSLVAALHVCGSSLVAASLLAHLRLAHGSLAFANVRLGIRNGGRRSVCGARKAHADATGQLQQLQPLTPGLG